MNKTNLSPIFLLIVLTLAVFVSSCSAKNNIFDSDAQVNMRTNQAGQISRIFETFSGFESESLETRMGQTISFDYEAIINKGGLIIEWQDPNGAVIWREILAESESGNQHFFIKIPGKYTIIIQGKQAKGSFSVSWKIQ